MSTLRTPRKVFSRSKKYLHEHPITPKTKGVSTNFDEVEKLHQESRNKYDRSTRIFRILTGLGATIFIASILFWVIQSVS